MNILIIEDNPTIAKQLVEFLTGHNWQVDYAHNGVMGVQLALNNIFDVILLDLNLPDIDGLQVCEQIKSAANVVPPILMLTARDGFEDKAKGFNHGADDYLTKPFDMRELVLRCNALARRQTLHQPKILSEGQGTKRVTLNLTDKTATRNDSPLKLTSIGFQVLTILMQSHPQPVSRSLLTHKLWGDSPPDSDALKSHIYGLRQALDKPFDDSILTTVMNVGFKLSFD